MPKVEEQSRDLLNNYAFPSPTLNMVSEPAMGEPGTFSRLTGVDGRYKGCLKRFPGFRQAYRNVVPSGLILGSNHTTPIKMFRYISIQPDAGSDNVLRGFIVLCSTEALNYLYFQYVDSGGTPQSELLFRFGATVGGRPADPTKGRFTIPLLASDAELDVTVDRRFIYVVWSGSTPGKVILRRAGSAEYDDVVEMLDTPWIPAPMDFLTADGDVAWTTTPGLQAYIYPPNTDTGVLRKPETGISLGDSIGVAFRFRCETLGVFSPLSEVRPFTNTSAYMCGVEMQLNVPDSLAYPFFGPTDPSHDSVGLTVEVEMYRTPASGYYAVADQALGVLWRERVEEVEAADIGTYFPADKSIIALRPDIALTASGQALSVEDVSVVTPLPDMDRITVFDGLTVISESVSSSNEGEVDRVRWSPLLRDRPLMFPVENARKLHDPSDRILEFVGDPSGQYLVGVTPNNLLLMVRNGDRLAVTTIANQYGAVGRHTTVAVGGVLYIVGRSAFVQVDVGAGTIQTIEALQHLVDDAGEWANSLGSVQAGYDAYLGALIFVNTEKCEAVLLWLNTGLITRLKNVPFQQITQGPDLDTALQHRVYCTGSPTYADSPPATMTGYTGLRNVFIPNAEGGGGVRSMNDVGYARPLNGVIEQLFEASGGFKLIRPSTLWDESMGGDDPETLTGSFVEFYRSGVLLQRSLIVYSDLYGQFVVDQSGSSPLAIGDVFHIAAVPFETIAWQLNVSQDPQRYERDIWSRKHVTGMGVRAVRISGDPLYQTVNHEVWGEDNGTKLASYSGSLRRGFVAPNAAGDILRPGWSQYASNVDFALIGAQIVGRIEGSRQT